MTLILALGKLRQVDLCEFKARLVYRVNSRTTRALLHSLCYPVSPNQTKPKQTHKNLSFVI